MLTSIWTRVLAFTRGSATTTLGIVPAVLLMLLGLVWDGTAGMLPCDKVNRVRAFLGITPLLCHLPKDNATVRIAGDSSCITAKHPETDKNWDAAHG